MIFIRFKELVGLELAKAFNLPFAVDAVDHSVEIVFSVAKPPMRTLLGVAAAAAAAAAAACLLTILLLPIIT